MNNKERLAQGLEALSLTLSAEQQEKLLAYVDLLIKWNSTYNLTALRQENKILSHHVLDSLSIVPFLNGCTDLLDVGSGGGMPGIPVAIACPEMNVTLLDSNSKKTTFLRQAVIELGLDNVTVENCRVEELQGHQFSYVTSRAFAELKDFITLTKALMAEGSCWLAMKGVYPYEELAVLPEYAKVRGVTTLDVPFVDAERHLVQIDFQGE